jgi:hypothetical protein
MVHENHPMKSGVKRTQRDYMLAFKLSVVNRAPRAPGNPEIFNNFKRLRVVHRADMAMKKSILSQ